MNNTDCPIGTGTGDTDSETVDEMSAFFSEPPRRTYPISVWFLPEGLEGVRWTRTDDGVNWYDIVEEDEDGNKSFLVTPIESRVINGETVWLSRLIIEQEDTPDHTQYRAFVVGQDVEVGIIVDYQTNHCLEWGC